MLHSAVRLFTRFYLRIHHSNLLLLRRAAALRILKLVKRLDHGVPALTASVCCGVGIAMAEKPDSDIVDEGLEQIIRTADNLFDRNEFAELLQYLTEYEECSEPRLLWRLSRACYKVAVDKETSKERAKELAYKALEIANKSLSMDTNSFSAHKWAGITLSHIGSYEGLTEKIKQAFAVKTHFEAALKVNPSDPTSWHLLGQWCYSVAEISWLERKVVSTVLAEPPKSSFHEALGCFERAEREQPGFYSMNFLYLAKACAKLDRRAEAVQWLDKLLAYPVANDEDANAVEMGRVLRLKLGS